MNTKPLPAPAQCQYERIDDKHQSYCCDKPARVAWIARPDAVIPVCPACLAWLKRLEDLEQL